MPSSSSFTIKFPSTIALQSGTCSITAPVSPMSSTAMCSVANNVLTVTNPFGVSGSYTAGGAALSFIFSTGGTNPGKACDPGNYIV